MKITTYTICCNLLLACLFCSCSQSLDEDAVRQPGVDVPVYRMQLHATWEGYEGATRSSARWEDGSKVYLRFHEPDGDVTGVATYNDEEEVWEIQPSRTLKPTGMDEASCQAIHFVNPTNLTSTRVSMSSESVIYVDTAASYMLYDDLLIVRAMLMPKTGRIRFKGSEGQSFGVSGLSYYNEYNFTSNKFSAKETKLTSTVGADGYSSFFHTFFADANDRTLVFDYTEAAGFKTTFGDAVLNAGASGSITIPTIDNMGYWTLVNKKNLEEIILPQTDVVTAVSVRSATALLRSAIISKGNGTVSDAGFVYSTSSTPTADNGTVVSCGTSTAMECRIKDLEPLTTYYAAAYVTNEKGTAWSDAIEFTTISMEEDKSSIEKSGFGDDDDLNGNSSSEGTISKGGFGNDDDLNGNSSSDGTIGKGGFGDDDDLNGNSSSDGTIGKGGFGDDDDLNGNNSSDGTIGKGGFGDDDDLNGNSSSDGTIGKGGFGNDDDLNGNSSSDGTIGKGGFGDDDNLNDTTSVQGHRAMSVIMERIKILISRKPIQASVSDKSIQTE